MDKFLVDKFLLWEFSAGKDEKNGFTVYLPCLECLLAWNVSAPLAHFTGLSQISLYEDFRLAILLNGEGLFPNSCCMGRFPDTVFIWPHSTLGPKAARSIWGCGREHPAQNV